MGLEGFGRKIITGAAVVAGSLSNAKAQEVKLPSAEMHVSMPEFKKGQFSENFDADLKNIRNQQIEIEKNLISADNAQISILENKDLFSKDFRDEIKEAQAAFNKAEKDINELKQEIEQFTDGDVGVLLSFVEEHHKSLEQSQGQSAYIPSPGFDSVDRLINADTSKEKVSDFLNGRFQTWLRRNLGKNEKMFLSYCAEHKNQNLESKTLFNNALDAVLESKRKNLPVDDESVIQAKIDTAWNSRVPIEPLKIQLLKKEKGIENLEKHLNRTDIEKSIEDARLRVYEAISQSSYLQKLIDGEHLTRDQALRVQKERLWRVANTSYTVEAKNFQNSGSEIEGDSIKNFTFSAHDVALNPETNAMHEWWHIATLGNHGMTEVAKAVYDSAWVGDKKFNAIKFSQQGEMAGIASQEEAAYYHNFTEMDARKKVLEVEMEKFGIKKISEPMTHEHYRKLIKLVQDGVLDSDSMQIILTTTEDGLIRAMNSVAVLDLKDNNSNIA